TQDTLPGTAATFVGDQVVFTAAYSNSPPANLQWLFISGGVTNVLAAQTNATLTLNNLQLTNSGSYLLKAVNATNSGLVAYSTARPLTVSSLPAAVNNMVTAAAAQTGLGGGTTFTPSWTVVTNGSLIAGQSPSTALGNFSEEAPGRSVNLLTAGGGSGITQIAGTYATTTSTNYVTCGNGAGPDGSSAGSSI